MSATFASRFFAPSPPRSSEAGGGYRQAAGFVERLRALAAARKAEVDALSPAAKRVYHRRLARSWAGAAGLATSLTCAALLALSPVDRALLELAPWLLVAVWPAMAVAYLAGRMLAPPWLCWRLRRWARVRERSEHELARLEERTTQQHAVDETSARECESIALPLAALSLAAPLSLHLVVSLGGGQTMKEFGTWMALSGIIVGHAHLFLAGASIWFARQLSRSAPEQLKMTGWRIYGLTVLVSAIPGILLVAIPPVLVAVTGLVFAPAMFGWARRAAKAERERLAAASAGVLR